MSDKEKKVKVDNLDPRDLKPAEAEALRGGRMPRGEATSARNDMTDSGDDGMKED
jgi:hypothetical protein